MSNAVAAETRDRHHVWKVEQALMQMIRQGNVNYESVLASQQMQVQGTVTILSDPLRQAKLSASTYTTLCVRAAMEGGLSPEIAYALGDGYLQRVERSQTTAQLASLNKQMYHNFVHAVHDDRMKSGLSEIVKHTVDYIETHLEQALSIEMLAQIAGYSRYYLSRKFSEEMGSSIGEFIREARIQQAKVMLIGTDQSLQDISDHLQFCSRSHFAISFKKVTGVTPVQFRKRTGT